MATNVIGDGADRKLAELAGEILRLQKVNAEHASAAENGAAMPAQTEPALAPLADRIAQGFATSLVMALGQLEAHIASENKKVGDAVGLRLDSLQAALADAVSEQRSLGLSVQSQCRELAAETAALREADAGRRTEIASLRQETSEQVAGLARELAVHQDDIAALKSTVNDVASRADSLLERLDRQAETLRSMCGTYAQRETELEQLVEGLARLRTFPAPSPAQGL